MIGGMVSSTILTLVVIPAIYALVKGIGLPGSASQIHESDVGRTSAAAFETPQGAK
jgi:Cu(I)/Ag(I) efflux system membrane protein CusA/SilA